MNRLYITDKGREVPVGELELLLNRQQVILGNAERDLILRTSGNIKIQVGNKFFDLPINTNSDGSTTINSGVIMLDFASDLLELDYPADGSLIFVRETGTLYIAANGLYIKLSSEDDDVDNSKIYLSYQDVQTLDGIQKYTVLVNSGYTISSIQDVINYSVQDVYPNQIVFSIAEGAHYQLTDDTEPNNVDHWKRLYTSLDGDTLRGRLIMGDVDSGSIEVRGDYNNSFLTPVEFNFKGYYLGKDYTKGLAIWQDDNTSYISSQDINGGTIKFLIGGSTTNPNNPLSIGNNNVGVGYIDYAYNFNVGGTSNFVGSVNLVNEMKSKDFVSGVDGVGFSLARDFNNEWTLEVDNLLVRNDTKVEKKYNTKAVNGSLILNFDLTIVEADIMETIPLYLERHRVGRYLADESEFPLSSKVTYANVIRTSPSTIDTPSEDTFYQLMPLAYGFGDRDSAGNLSGYELLNKDVANNLYTPDGTHRFDVGTQQFVEDPAGDLVKVTDITLYMLTIKGDVANYAIGDLFYYRAWDEDKEEQSTFYVQVVNILDNELYVYSYGDDLDLVTELIRIGNITDQETFIQLNGASKDAFIELNSDIASFNDFVDNIYFDESLIETGSHFKTDTIRFRSGELSKIEDVDLGLSLGNGGIGIYSDNAYIKGNFVGNRLVLGPHLIWDGTTFTAPGYVRESRTITINSITQNLSADRTWNTPLQDVLTQGNTFSGSGRRAMYISSTDEIAEIGTFYPNISGSSVAIRSGSDYSALTFNTASTINPKIELNSSNPINYQGLNFTFQNVVKNTIFKDGRMSGSDAINNNEFVTKAQISSLSPAITADNGLTKTGNNIQLGGPLLATTLIGTNAASNAFLNIVPNAGAALVYVNAGSQQTKIDVNASTLSLIANNGVGSYTSITLPSTVSTGITVTDTIGSVGIIYTSDYSIAGKAQDRWIPDWGAVKSIVPTANNGLSVITNIIQLGGPLVKDTYVTAGDYIMRFGGRTIFEGTQSYVYGGIRHYGRDENNLNSQVYSQMGPTTSFYGIMGDRASIGAAITRTGIEYTKATGTPFTMTIYDDNESFGMKYNGNFSAKGILNDRWIPDWGTVKSLIPTPTLQSVTNVGNTTTNDVALRRSDSIPISFSVQQLGGSGGTAQIQALTATQEYAGLFSSSTNGSYLTFYTLTSTNPRIVLQGGSFTALDFWLGGVNTNRIFRDGRMSGTAGTNPNDFATVSQLGGGGSGSVTSVAMSVPTGFTIGGSPITTAGTLALGFDPAYSLPSITKQTNWDTAYSWGDHAGLYKLASYVPTWTDVTGKPTNLSQFTNDLGNYGNWITKAQGDTYYYPLSSNPSGYLTSFTESDPTVPSHVKAITTVDIARWDSASGGLWTTAGTGYIKPALGEGIIFTGIIIEDGGEITSVGDITASHFYKSSDMRLKDLAPISIKGIDSIDAFGFKYKKSESQNYGYSAQQVQDVMPCAISKSEDGMLKVDYQMVLTAKVQRLEDEVKDLRQQLNNLK